MQAVSSPRRLEGVAIQSGDKSISHRALLLNSIARGTAHVSNFCEGDDGTSMLRCLRGLGAQIKRHRSCPITQAEECFEIRGRGPDGLQEPTTVLDAGNSATTLRLLAGLLAAQPFLSVITGDRSLRSRPMDRVVHPLLEMGATVLGRHQDSRAPLAIRGGDLRGIEHTMPVPSAQLKGCVLLAGLHARGDTTVHQSVRSRDHTERFLEAMGADLSTDGLSITVRRSELASINVRVPGDISSAAFWLVAGSCHPNSRIVIKDTGTNPTRTGVLDVLRNMGANISMENVNEDGVEPSADLVVESSRLRPTEIGGEMIPRVIDELPVLALAACFADGTTVIRDARELRVKESDRIQSTVASLSSLGARIEERPDGMVIHGGNGLKGGECQSFDDHRIAMTMGVAGLLAEGETMVDGAEAANVSYPGFWDTLNKLRRP